MSHACAVSCTEKPMIATTINMLGACEVFCNPRTVKSRSIDNIQSDSVHGCASDTGRTGACALRDTGCWYMSAGVVTAMACMARWAERGASPLCLSAVASRTQAANGARPCNGVGCRALAGCAMAGALAMQGMEARRKVWPVLHRRRMS